MTDNPTLSPSASPRTRTPRCARSRSASSSARKRRARTCGCSSRPRAGAGGDGPRAVLRPAGARQDHAGADRRARDGGRVPRHLGPGDRARRRPRRAADQPRAARRVVHRRDPPAQSGGRGSALPGDGRPRARPDHRRRALGALGADRPAAVHADRCDHAPGSADHPAARPLRHPGAAPVLHRARARACGDARREPAGHRDRSRGRARDRAPFARHAPRGGPPAAPGARLCPCRRRGDDHRRAGRPGVAPARGRSRSGSTRWTGAIS